MKAVSPIAGDLSYVPESGLRMESSILTVQQKSAEEVAHSMVQEFLQLSASKLAAARANMDGRRNLLYLRSEKLWALLSRRNAKTILFSGKADWEDDIQSGFWRLHHQVDFGPIAEDSFQRYDIVVPVSFPA